MAPNFALTSKPTEFGCRGLLCCRGLLGDTASRCALEPCDLSAGSGYQQRGLCERRGLGDIGGLIEQGHVPCLAAPCPQPGKHNKRPDPRLAGLSDRTGKDLGGGVSRFVDAPLCQRRLSGQRRQPAPPCLEATFMAERQPRRDVAFGEYPLPPCREQRRGVHVGPGHAKLVSGLLGQLPAAIQLGQAIKVAIAQLSGADDVQCVAYRVQASDPLSHVDRPFSPAGGLIVPYYAKHRGQNVVGAREFRAGR